MMNTGEATSSCLADAGPKLDCDDQNSCTIDACDPDSGRILDPSVQDPCDDGNFCTEKDACIEGACAGVPVECPGTGNRCIPAVCDADKGCVPTPKPEGSACDDGDPCTETDGCASGLCVGKPIEPC